MKKLLTTPKLLSLIIFVLLLGAYAYTFAIGSPYQAGSTLDPLCIPGEINCYVQILPDQSTHAGQFLQTNGSTVSWQSVAGSSYTFSTGLTNTGGTITNNLSTGVSGGQTLTGGTDLGDNLTITSTSDITKGLILFGTSAYDENSNFLGLGTTNPNAMLSIFNAGTPSTYISAGNDPSTGRYLELTDHTFQVGDLDNGTGALFTVDHPNNTFTFARGSITVGALGGSGTRMVVTDNNGLLSTQAIPGGGGGTTTLQQAFDADPTTEPSIDVGTNYVSIFGTGNTTASIINLGSGIALDVQNNGINTAAARFGSYGGGALAVAVQAFGFNSRALELVRNGGGNTPTSVSSVMTVSNQGSDGHGGVGFGSSIDFTLQTLAPTERASNSIISRWTNAGIDTETSEFVIKGTETQVSSELFTLAGSGALKLNNYGVGSFTGIPAYSLVVDASGNIVEGGINPITIQNTNSLFSTGLGGTGAGSMATESIFLGTDAGNGAINAAHAYFIGTSAGQDATNASSSNFFGYQAGYGATNAYRVNFIGESAGLNATDVSSSNFIGDNAGNGAINASYSNFFGDLAGQNASNAANSIFIGRNAGLNDTVDNTGNIDDYSILIGNNTSTGGFSNSIVLGSGTNSSPATNTKTNQFMLADSITDVRWRGVEYALPSIQGSVGQVLTNDGSGGLSWFLPDQAINYVDASYVGKDSGPTNNGLNGGGGLNIFLGASAGQQLAGGPSTVSSSIFLGHEAGNWINNVTQSTFIGEGAGNQASTASYSNFIGGFAGSGATNADHSNFFGNSAGNGAQDAAHSTFIGENAGKYLVTGVSTGLGSRKSAHSIYIGTNAGYSATDFNVLDNTTNADDFSILIGNNTSTGGFSNSIALGANATNTATNQFMIGSTTRRIDTMVFNGGVGNTCSIVSGTGITCSSDERLKTNITDLDTTTLDKVLSLRTVTYNWNSDPSGKRMIGFIAQNLQQSFPELVSQNVDGMLSVNYAQITPAIVEAIREMNIKIQGLSSLDTKVSGSLGSLMKGFLGDVGNQLDLVFFGEVHAKKLCLEDVCVNKDQLQQLLTGSAIQSGGGGGSVTVTPPTEPTDPTVEQPSGDTTPPTDPVVDQPPVETTPTSEPVVATPPAQESAPAATTPTE